ncbi:hypothetical protein R6Q57_009294 [Mikania cordata]
MDAEVRDKQLKAGDDFGWALEVQWTEKFIIEVEFLYLKTASPNGEEYCSIWAEGLIQKESSANALSSHSRMLVESIHTYITVNAFNGIMRARPDCTITRLS